MTAAPPPASLATDRLVLRRWHDADRAPFAAINADPEVMATLPAPLTRAESDAFVDRIEACFHQRGHGLWVLTRVDDPADACLGYVGLWPADAGPALDGAVEVGWRLAAPAWGRGFATEAARAAVADGFERLGLDEIVSFTWEGNRRSRSVMEKLGMVRDPDGDFDHPRLAGHRLEHHVLYRLARPADPGR